jgi:hypothetical protein
MIITSTRTVEDAAKLHCRYWDSPAWEQARVIRDRIIDERDPEWPNDAFWSEVDKLAPRPE